MEQAAEMRENVLMIGSMKAPTRRILVPLFVFLLFVDLFLACAVASSAALEKEPSKSVPAPRPNVLLIVMDAVRPDHLSCYGYPKATSPNLDRLAREGTLYETCITAGSWTLPSLASLFTGLYQRDHEVSSRNLRLSGSFFTLAEILKSAGYATVGFSANAWVGDFSGLNQGFDEFTDVWRGLDDARGDDGAEVCNQWIFDWLETSYNDSRPFFMFVLFFEPHFPYRPPPAYREKFLPENADRDLLTRLRNWEHPREVGYILKVPGMEITPNELLLLESQYNGEIAYMDQRIGELLEELERRKILDNTITILTSDHGEHLGEHGLLDHKMSLYEEVIRVPLIIRYPERVPAGQRIRSQVQNLNLLPTILKLCGVTSPAKQLFDPLPLRASPGGEQRFAFVEFGPPDMFLDVMREAFAEFDSSRFSRSLKAVRTLEQKLIWSSDGRHELYDLVSDPGETKNLFEKQPELAGKMLKALDDFNRSKLPPRSKEKGDGF